MDGHDIVVVGASAGGVEALSALAAGLPEHFPAAVFVVLHLPQHSTSVLPQILDRAGPLPAAHARDGEPISAGRIYVAPPDRHMVLEPGCVRLVRGPRENGHRPAIDTLFRSAARAYGGRTVGVILSGTLDDGTAGLAAVKSRHGLGVVQDPASAIYAGMPQSAIENVAVDYVARLAEIPALLQRLVQQPPPPQSAPMPRGPERETETADMDAEAQMNEGQIGVPSGFTCPECHGALWQIEEGEILRFRCRVGHAFSGTSLLAAEAEALDAALWIALRALEETAALRHKLSARMRNRGRLTTAQRFERQARAAEESARVIHKVLLHGPSSGATDGDEDGEIAEPATAIGDAGEPAPD